MNEFGNAAAPVHTQPVRRRIMVDVDGTLTTMARALQLFNQQFGTRLTRFSLTRYDFPALAGLTREEGDAWWERHAEILYGSERMQPGASEVLRRLVARGFEPWIVTARPESARVLTTRWLERRSAPYAGIVMNATDKLAVCEDLGVVAAIEDSPTNALQIAERLPVILIRWGHNQHLRHERIYPVTRWSEVEEALLRAVGTGENMRSDAG